jgi:hypothetical protein
MGNWIDTEIEITSVQFKGIEILEKIKNILSLEDEIKVLENNGLYVKGYFATKNGVPMKLYFDLTEQYEDTTIRITFSEMMLDLAGVAEFINGRGLINMGEPVRDKDNPYSITNPFRKTQFNFDQEELNKNETY